MVQRFQNFDVLQLYMAFFIHANKVLFLLQHIIIGMHYYNNYKHGCLGLKAYEGPVLVPYPGYRVVWDTEITKVPHALVTAGTHN